MKCFFCKRDENEINNHYSSFISSLEKEVSDIDIKINEKISDYKRDNHFTDKHKEKINNIHENILNFTIDYFKDKYDALVKLDQNIELLMSYMTNFNPNISNTDTIKYLVKLFINEPTEERTFPFVKELKDKKEEVKNYIKQIQDNLKFHKIDDKDKEFFSKIEKEMMIGIVIKNPYYYKTKETENGDAIFLCPYCMYLFVTHQNAKNLRNKELSDNASALRGKYDDIPDWDFN